MICKWCGAVVSKQDQTCQRCKRPLPALSDCGGFYDLVPDAAQAAPAPQPVPQPVPQPAPQPVPHSRPAPRKLSPFFRWFPVGATTVLLVMAMLMGFVLARLSEAERQVRQLSEELEEHLEQTAEIPEESRATEPSQTLPSESNPVPSTPEPTVTEPEAPTIHPTEPSVLATDPTTEPVTEPTTESDDNDVESAPSEE